MDNEVLRKVQLTQFSIAKEIKRVCDKHDIEYILDSGTLLGAVRHGGFIPWDDDMDIGMTRDNYNRFLEIAKTELGKDYFLQTWDTDKNYPLPFAKVRLNGTTFIEDVLEKAHMHHGIYVDIFAYDVWPENKRQQKKLWRKRLYLQGLIRMKCHYLKFKSDAAWKYFIKAIMFTFIKFLSLFYTKKGLVKRHDQVIAKFNQLKSDNIYEHTANVKFGHCVVPKTCLEGLIDLKFEDDVFKCPSNYDEYLRIIYGDYMKLPPEEKRLKGHKITKVDFGDFKHGVNTDNNTK